MHMKTSQTGLISGFGAFRCKCSSTVNNRLRRKLLMAMKVKGQCKKAHAFE